MRLLLQGKDPDPFNVDDLWVLMTQSDALNIASYLVQGYTMGDCHLVGGGGGGGAGGDSYYVANAQNNAGGGGGGGGAGQYTKYTGFDLRNLPGSVPVTVGEGGDGGLDYRFSAANGQDGKPGGLSQFLNIYVSGGDGGGTGGDATANYHAGGGAGGAAASSPQVPKTYWDPASPTIAAKGSKQTSSSTIGNGGNAGVTTNPNPGGTQNPLPVAGGDGSVVGSFNVIPGGGPIYAGGGGGGGGGSASYTGDPTIAKALARGARGGKSPSSGYGDQGLVGPGILLPNNIWRYAGIGGGGGAGHDLTSITKYPGLDGIPTIVTPFDGRPGAGGMGGNGGYYVDVGTFGTVGLKGSSGCALFRFYRV